MAIWRPTSGCTGSSPMSRTLNLTPEKAETQFYKGIQIPKALCLLVWLWRHPILCRGTTQLLSPCRAIHRPLDLRILWSPSCPSGCQSCPNRCRSQSPFLIPFPTFLQLQDLEVKALQALISCQKYEAQCSFLLLSNSLGELRDGQGLVLAVYHCFTRTFRVWKCQKVLESFHFDISVCFEAKTRTRSAANCDRNRRLHVWKNVRGPLKKPIYGISKNSVYFSKS